MASFEPDLLILLIGLAAIVLTFAIIAAVLYLWKMLRKEVRWPGLQNPYGWPADMIGDLDAHTVDKSVCKQRLRPSRLEKNAKKFHKTLADVLPEAEPPPVPVRVDSLTSSDRRALESVGRQMTKNSEKEFDTIRSMQGPAIKQRQSTVEKKSRNTLEGVFPSTSNASASEEQVKVRRDRKRASSGYRDEKRRSPKNSFREHSYLPQAHLQPAQRERPNDHAIEITEDNEPPPPYSEVRRYP
ncbi:uncharacterized protein LOC111249004 isoform X1 [Varroa destructor]|uniref:Uncharacterized protein n=2 Tax=Varroa destructor TaxID=109461 RepID=A0A7M7JVX0_VARDE|nr:uncharacterized protein LOC111249004 isoform X1 [Varroa destructor]XP_022657973.1 uncharacterized protein LOC111249004 isoform X1 [Varroa destructor]